MNETQKNKLIIIWLFIALYDAIRIRSFISVIIVLFTLFRHLQYKHTKYVDRNIIKIGSFILAIEGFRLDSFVISFTGTYSFISKYGEYSEKNREILRFIIATIVWIIIWGIILIRLRNKKKINFFG